MRVLLFEDDTDLLDVTAYALRKHGHERSSAWPMAPRQWSVGSANEPDLVLLDVNLPHMSGFDICREIRKRSSTPIIMVTAPGTTPRWSKALRLAPTTTS